MNDESQLDTSSNSKFYQTTIIDHFEQARNADNEASFLESKINQLEDQCEQYRETIRNDQIKYDKTLSQIQMNQTLRPRSFFINIQNDFDDDPKVRAVKREIKDLKLKIKCAKNQILKYQSTISNQLSENPQSKIIYAQTVSPQMAKNLKHNYNYENEYKEQINNLKKQISSLDKRKVLANRILAMPIDDLYSDELIAEKAERSYLKLQQRFEISASPTKSNVDITHLELELKNIIAHNKQRRQFLEKRKQYIQKMKEQNFNENGTFSIRTPKKKLTKNISNQVVGKEHVDSLNTIYLSLKSRAENIDKKEAETDQMIKEVEKMRSQMKSHYHEKMQIVSNLSSRFREIQNIQIQIHTLSEQNTQLLLSLKDIEDERSRMKRKESNISSNKSKILQQKSNIKVSKESFNELQKKINEKDKELLYRKNEIAKTKEQIKKRTIELLLLRGRVELLETQVTQMISNANLRENEAKQEKTELSISMIEKNEQQQNSSLTSGSFI